MDALRDRLSDARSSMDEMLLLARSLPSSEAKLYAKKYLQATLHLTYVDLLLGIIEKKGSYTEEDVDRVGGCIYRITHLEMDCHEGKISVSEKETKKRALLASL